MNENSILKVENLSKQYRLGLVGKETMRDDFKRWWYKIRGKEDPFLTVGNVNDRTTTGLSEYIWALQNINFEVKKGEVLGIIGANGAGKSTLLKILSRITSPTVGSVKFNGRIASLLEVGTGFHGELTGRENIYLNGAILGMTRDEITSKIDEIIDFSGCLAYIDTPVKRYSSGMTVRLAFAVAAFLEPDILIIDEVLAVGDAEFQKKAIGKMQDISRSEKGRTVLFVSHNMASVRTLCSSCILLEKGEITFRGKTDVAVNKYLNNFSKDQIKGILERKDRIGNGDAVLENYEYINKDYKSIKKPVSGEFIKIKFKIRAKRYIERLIIGVTFCDENNNLKGGINNDEHGYFLKLNVGSNYVELEFKRLMLFGGIYYLNVLLSEENTHDSNKLDLVYNAIEMEVLPGDFWGIGKNNRSRNTPIIDGVFKIVDYE